MTCVFGANGFGAWQRSCRGATGACPCNGRRGELAAPTDKLLAALKLAFDRERRCGRVVVVHPLDEF